jgi:mannose-6-phosphate isomerase-like protein (cupin superfamily)
MDAFEIADIQVQREEVGTPYLEFLRVPDLSAGLYVLPAGSTDPQQPHTEDEVYYVVSGQAIITVGDEERPVRPGSFVFVPATVEHRFHSITDDLSLLVVFAPARNSRRP